MDDKIEAAIADLEKGLEEREKGAARAAAGHLYGPHPTLALVKFWQGAVEICIRATIIILSLAVLISASVSIRDVSIDTSDTSSHVKELVCDGQSAAVFVLCVSLTATLLEVFLVLMRFLNFGAVNRFLGAFLLLNIATSFLLSVFYFSGSVALAVASEQWKEQNEDWEGQGVTLNSRSQRIPVNLAVSATLGLVTLVPLLVLGVWLALFLVYNWNRHMGRQQRKPELRF